MKTDAHMHSSFSYDAEVCPKKMIEASIQKGLKAICFTIIMTKMTISGRGRADF